MAGSQRIARPTMLQRVMARVVPGWGLNRALSKARSDLALARVHEARAHYDAAKRARKNQAWRLVGEDANAATRGNLMPLRAIARDMVRNNPHAKHAVDAITSNVIGDGIMPQVKGVSRTRQKAIEKLIRRHMMTPAIDADGLHNLAGLQALVMRTIVVSGEALVRRRWRGPSDDLPLPFQLQVLEPDFIDHMIDGPLSNGNTAVQGVEFDKIGRRVAYYLFSEHPSAAVVSTTSPRSKRVSADDVAHIFLAERPGQARGVTWFAPVIRKLGDFADYSDAQLVRQKIAACFAAFVTGDAEAEQEINGEMSETGKALEAFEPGMIEYLGPGESVEFANPPKVDDYEGFQLATLHEIAAGLNIPYTVLSADLRQVNFSSGRMGWIEFGRMISQWQTLMLEPMLFYRVSRWLADALLIGKGIKNDFEVDWVPPRREMIDPDKEIRAASQAVRNGFSSRSYEQRRFGFDPEDLEDEIENDNKRADERGFVFDSDPRKTAAQGSRQPDAAEEGDSPPTKPAKRTSKSKHQDGDGDGVYPEEK